MWPVHTRDMTQPRGGRGPTPAPTWTDPEDTGLREGTQTQKDASCRTPLPGGPQRRPVHRDRGGGGSQGWGGGPCGEMEVLETEGGGGCRAGCVCLVPLALRSETVKTVNFMSCVFYHKEGREGGEESEEDACTHRRREEEAKHRGEEWDTLDLCSTRRHPGCGEPGAGLGQTGTAGRAAPAGRTPAPAARGEPHPVGIGGALQRRNQSVKLRNLPWNQARLREGGDCLLQTVWRCLRRFHRNGILRRPYGRWNNGPDSVPVLVPWTLDMSPRTLKGSRRWEQVTAPGGPVSSPGPPEGGAPAGNPALLVVRTEEGPPAGQGAPLDGTRRVPMGPGGSGGDQPCPPEVQHWETRTVPAAAGSQCRPFVDDADPGETLAVGSGRWTPS